MAEKETVAGAKTNAEAAALKADAQQPEQIVGAEPEAGAVVMEPAVGPEGAAPHWREFYQAIRDAVEAMRS
ncbi:hypothetical protein A8990_11144 [Paenibacillus taihuensis]|uniref:Uncharacterized protein n=1 Tax=Paenibacillus taihuensis TaxID=1156355 RepID=A0A3D9S126_9BACL|nr:hypothetical protein [Paenibacillus taihuensis]REE86147.1 hypothetical protein A8990_11144 [Paenibacillus taihuensis]